MANFKNIKALTTGALLVAIAIILGFFKIPISSIIEIQFGTIPLAVSGSLLGPGMSAIVGALSDIGAYFVNPTGAFCPGFTLSAILTGVIFGFLLYKKDVTFLRLLAAHTLNAILVSYLLNTVWLSLLYGIPFIAVLVSRSMKELIMFPINFLILLTILKPMTSNAFFRKWSIAIR